MREQDWDAGVGAAVPTCRERGGAAGGAGPGGSASAAHLSSLLLLLASPPAPRPLLLLSLPLPLGRPARGASAVPRKGHSADPGHVTASFRRGWEGCGSRQDHLLVFSAGLVVRNWQLRGRFCDFSGCVWKGEKNSICFTVLRVFNFC